MSDPPMIDTGRRLSDVRERYRLEALADYLGIIALWSIVLFAGQGEGVNLGCVGGIVSIATVSGYMKHKGIAGGALVLMATWPVAKLVAALGGASYRHFG